MKVKLTHDRSVQSASTKLLLSMAAGLVAGVIAGVIGGWKYLPLAVWEVGAAVYMGTTWWTVLRFDAPLVKKFALREDPSRWLADGILLVASVASLAAVVLVLVSSKSAGPAAAAGPILSVLSVVISWLTVHTVYTLRYAELYYTAPEGGVDFGNTKDPIYSDFAYLAFTLGMTYQVSDTSLQSRRFRVVALKQALLSYVFGTVIVATVINLVAGLSK